MVVPKFPPKTENPKMFIVAQVFQKNKIYQTNTKYMIKPPKKNSKLKAQKFAIWWCSTKYGGVPRSAMDAEASHPNVESPTPQWDSRGEIGAEKGPQTEK